jgi:hypothetical protein
VVRIFLQEVKNVLPFLPLNRLSIIVPGSQLSENDAPERFGYVLTSDPGGKDDICPGDMKVDADATVQAKGTGAHVTLEQVLLIANAVSLKNRPHLLLCSGATIVGAKSSDDVRIFW